MMQIIRPLLLMFLLPAVLVFGQENISVHKLHKELYGTNSAKPSRFSKDDKIIPLQPRTEKELNKVVFGYLPDWEYGNNGYSGMQYNLLTHLACFDFMVESDGSVSNPGYWPWVDVINSAHEAGVKIILTAVTFDAPVIKNLIDDETAKANFFNNIKQKMIAYEMDGVNIDFEDLYTSDRGARINGFMSDLTTFIHGELPGKEVSFAGPAINWSNHWDLAGLAESCDYIFIMGYAFAGSWSTSTSPNAPLTGGTYNMTNSVYIQYGEVLENHPEKLILGVPYYGVKWRTEDDQENGDIIDFINSPRYRDTYNEANVHGTRWSEKYTNSWYAYNSNGWYQVWFDDAQTLSYKYDIVLAEDLLGTGMWALGYDNGKSDLWNLLDQKFGDGQSVPPDAPDLIYAEVLSTTSVGIKTKLPQNAFNMKIYLEENGADILDSVVTTSGTAVFNNLTPGMVYNVIVRAGNLAGFSAPSEKISFVVSFNKKEVLIVNGFDREVGGDNTRDYMRHYSLPLREIGFGSSGASNEAVISGEVNLNDYEHVFWILGEESTADETFSATERELVASYLNNGGHLFVSGSEVGWDIGREGFSDESEIDFYNNYLKAEYIDDAPENSPSQYYGITPSDGIFSQIEPFYFDNGEFGTYNVEYPDVIKGVNGGENVLSFTGTNPEETGYAGITYDGVFPGGTVYGKLVYFTFPFETIVDSLIRVKIMGELIDFFESPTGLDETTLIAGDYKLLGNYPNPFNPETKISFVTPQRAEITVSVFNVLGEKIYQFAPFESVQGVNNISWKPAPGTASGIYLYRIEYRSETKSGQFTGKLNYLK